MKMILFTDTQYYRIQQQILEDKGLQAQFASATWPPEKPTWEQALASALLRGAVDVPDTRAQEQKGKKQEFIRYGYSEDGEKKNVLYTIKDENRGLIYYGVSRCALGFDQFKKKEGVKLAKERAETARRVGHNHVPRFLFHNSEEGHHHLAPMYGIAKLECLSQLLDWFDAIH